MDLRHVIWKEIEKILEDGPRFDFSFSPDNSFSELRFDALDIIEIAYEMQILFDVHISKPETEIMQTLNDLIDCVFTHASGKVDVKCLPYREANQRRGIDIIRDDRYF